MSDPQISLVIPVYNGATTLESCLESVRRALAALPPRRREEVEVLICDNHSTDESTRIAGSTTFARMSTLIRPPIHLPNRTDNWRHALSAGRGRWLLMLHADDALMARGLEAWLDAIASPLAAGVGFITARHHTFTDDLDVLSPPHPRFAPAPALLPGRALARWVLPLICPFVPFVLIRRDAYEAVGGLDSSLELTQDWDLWIRLCRLYDVLYVPHVVGAWRRHPTSPKYQRVNMTEHLRVLEEMEAHRAVPVPRPIRMLARRSLQARVQTTLQSDPHPEAQRIRELTSSVGSTSLSHGWLRTSGAVVSTALFALRTAGAVRANLPSRAAASAA